MEVSVQLRAPDTSPPGVRVLGTHLLEEKESLPLPGVEFRLSSS
jgi:hypothetical protein